MKRCVLLALVLVACKKEPAGPSCDKIADHMLEVTKQQMPGHAGMGDFGDRKGMIAQCEKRNLSAAMRKCLMTAKSLGDFADCQAKEKPATTAPVPPPAMPPQGTVPTPVTPTGSGS
jgi:hypothetical protein